MLAAGMIMALAVATGCEVGREFRAAAGPRVQTGVTDIVNGLLEGIFAAIDLDDSTAAAGAQP